MGCLPRSAPKSNPCMRGWPNGMCWSSSFIQNLRVCATGWHYLKRTQAGANSQNSSEQGRLRETAAAHHAQGKRPQARKAPARTGNAPGSRGKPRCHRGPRARTPRKAPEFLGTRAGGSAGWARQAGLLPAAGHPDVQRKPASRHCPSAGSNLKSCSVSMGLKSLPRPV